MSDNYYGGTKDALRIIQEAAKAGATHVEIVFPSGQGQVTISVVWSAAS